MHEGSNDAERRNDMPLWVTVFLDNRQLRHVLQQLSREKFMHVLYESLKVIGRVPFLFRYL